MLSDIEKLQNDFDELLMRLCHEKARLDIDVMTANIRHITQYEELSLLKEFEKRETTFTSRYKTKKKEKAAMAVKVCRGRNKNNRLWDQPLNALIRGTASFSGVKLCSWHPFLILVTKNDLFFSSMLVCFETLTVVIIGSMGFIIKIEYSP